MMQLAAMIQLKLLQAKTQTRLKDNKKREVYIARFFMFKIGKWITRLTLGHISVITWSIS